MTDGGADSPNGDETSPASRPRSRSAKLPTIAVVVVFYVLLLGMCFAGLGIAFVLAARR